MKRNTSRLEDIEFRDESIKKIALYFEVPQDTASSWKRNIGDVEVLKQTLGQNGPENYLDLIQRREWIPHELEEIENEWVEPLKQLMRCRVESAEDIYLVNDSDTEASFNKKEYFGSRSTGIGSGLRVVEPIKQPPEERDSSLNSGFDWSDEILELQEELKQKKERVKYEMRRYDPEWIGLVKERRQVDNTLTNIYQAHIQNSQKDFQYKKDKITELKRSFPYLRSNNKLIVEATGSSISYVRQFRHTEAGKIINQKPPKILKNKVRERDGDECVRCNARDKLQVHHLIPRTKGGEHEAENMATLCEECHKLAHKRKDLDDREGFGEMNYEEVAYENKEDFWENWVAKES